MPRIWLSNYTSNYPKENFRLCSKINWLNYFILLAITLRIIIENLICQVAHWQYSNKQVNKVLRPQGNLF